MKRYILIQGVAGSPPGAIATQVARVLGITHASDWSDRAAMRLWKSLKSF